MTNRMHFCSRLAWLFVLTTLVPAAAADPVRDRLENSPRHHEWQEVETSSGRTVRCWVVFPEVDEPATTVVLIHENRGLNDWARSAADQVAEAGFLCVAPDLLSQTGPGGGGTESYESDDAARNAISKLPPQQVLDDLDAVVAHARGLEAGNRTVAVAGFCWGGSQTFRYATHNPQIAAAFVFYGSAPEDAAAYRKIQAPVYGFYGGNDFRITGQVPDVKEKMKQAGKPYEAVIYDGAGHAFMRIGEGPDASDENRAARRQAWKRWNDLLSKLPAADATEAGTDAEDTPGEAAKVSVTAFDDVKPLEFSWGWIRWLMNAELDPDAEMTLGVVYIKPNQSNPLHMHPNSAEYLHVLSGSCEHRLGDQWVTLNAGDTIRIPKGQVHLARTKDEGCKVIVVFDTGHRQMVVVEDSEP
jgi:carboxymethylenebutenolidase